MKDRADPSAPRVAVIGGGFAGLTAARRLAINGAAVTLYEAGSRLGGLAAGFELAGERVEQAYHFLYRTDEHILSLVKELGLEDQLAYHKSSLSTFEGGRLYPMHGPLDLLRFRPLSLPARIRAGLVVLWLQRVKDWRSLTRIPALDWLRRYAGREVAETMWKPLLQGKFDRYFDRVTMAWLWGRIRQRVDSRDPKLGGEALGYFDGGFRVVTEALEADLRRHGGDIRLRTPVERIRSAPSGGAEIVAESPAERYEQVLVTVPNHVFSNMLDEDASIDHVYLEKLRRTEYLDAALLVFASKQKFTNFYWHNVTDPSAGFLVLLSLTNLVGPEKFGGKHIYYVGDYIPREHRYMVMSEEQLKDEWYASLKKIFPNFDRGAVIDDAVFRLRNAQHIVDVGFDEDKLMPHETPLDGVTLCNFSQIFPMDRGTNYAVRDGERMARRILDALHSRSPSARQEAA